MLPFRMFHLLVVRIGKEGGLGLSAARRQPGVVSWRLALSGGGAIQEHTGRVALEQGGDFATESKCRGFAPIVLLLVQSPVHHAEEVPLPECGMRDEQEGIAVSELERLCARFDRRCMADRSGDTSCHMDERRVRTMPHDLHRRSDRIDNGVADGASTKVGAGLRESASDRLFKRMTGQHPGQDRLSERSLDSVSRSPCVADTGEKKPTGERGPLVENGEFGCEGGTPRRTDEAGPSRLELTARCWFLVFGVVEGRGKDCHRFDFPSVRRFLRSTGLELGTSTPFTDGSENAEAVYAARSAPGSPSRSPGQKDVAD